MFLQLKLQTLLRGPRNNGCLCRPLNRRQCPAAEPAHSWHPQCWTRSLLSGVWAPSPQLLLPSIPNTPRSTALLPGEPANSKELVPVSPCCPVSRPCIPPGQRIPTLPGTEVRARASFPVRSWGSATLSSPGRRPGQRIPPVPRDRDRDSGIPPLPGARRVPPPRDAGAGGMGRSGPAAAPAAAGSGVRDSPSRGRSSRSSAGRRSAMMGCADRARRACALPGGGGGAGAARGRGCRAPVAAETGRGGAERGAWHRGEGGGGRQRGLSPGLVPGQGEGRGAGGHLPQPPHPAHPGPGKVRPADGRRRSRIAPAP